ncbi:MAG: TonB-dependent receptor [Acidobacteria bacterium]|nr:TonB-dependent receptor [Acidobacteriota bacterium]
MKSVRGALLLILLVAAAPAVAQQSAGGVTGFVFDAQGAVIPGATVTATNADTGFVREVVSGAEGAFLLNALPVGTYTVEAALDGFAPAIQPAVVVNVSRTTDLRLTLQPARLESTVTVTAALHPLVSTSDSSVGQVVSRTMLENMPLNGRQFGNLAAVVPGVGLGFHSDPTKSSQYSAQVAGGQGRNLNFQMDGGDNNDDTVGGLLQLFPLESVQEFNLLTQRYKAEYGRSNGGVLNVVTKSGTNELRGTWFTLLRDDALNARTFTETVNDIEKQYYRRYQFGGSAGGPLVQNRLHYFAAYERTQQDTRQVVDTLGLFPADNGVYATPYRENLFSTKVTANLDGGGYLAVRYGRNSNSQPYGAALRAARSTWTTSSNEFSSLNASYNAVLSSSRLNEAVFQYATFANDIPNSSTLPYLAFPNGVTTGANPAAPQSTEQTKWQFRDDFTWWAGSGLGVSHTVKAGVNWIHEPHLYITTGSTSPQFTMASNSLTGPVQQVFVIGGAGAVNIPLDQVGLYVQDDWRATPRLTLNLGLRWDYVAGMPINQDNNPNFVALQAAGRAGRFDGTVLDDFGQEPRGDWNNIQPRLGFAYDLGGNGRDVIRGGWGIYTDFAYTNANALTPALDALGGVGLVFFALDPAGIRKSDGTLFSPSDPLSSIAAQNGVDPSVPPLGGHVLSPRIEQPYSYQTNLGWARQLGPSTSFSADYVRVEGRDLNMRLRVNTLVDGRRNLAGLAIQPNSFAFRTSLSQGRSLYDGLILALNRRLANSMDLTASYTLARAWSDIGTSSDELNQNLVQDVRDPFGAVQQAPSARTDARHRVTVAAVVQAPWAIQVSPFFTFRSALPIHTFEGIDFNRDGNVNDSTPTAYRFTGLNDDGSATFEEAGACETVNCSRGAAFSQMNLRVSRGFRLAGSARIEAIAEVYNLFNATNPSFPLSSRRLAASGAALGSFMQPTAFAGDFQQPEQRVAQLGFRVSF